MNLDCTIPSGAYELVQSFRYTNDPHPSLWAFAKRGNRGLLVLKAMQLTATIALGSIALISHSRRTAAKLYQDAVTLADTYTPFVTASPLQDPLERWAWTEACDARSILSLIIDGDTETATALGNAGLGCKEVSVAAELRTTLQLTILDILGSLHIRHGRLPCLRQSRC